MQKQTTKKEFVSLFGLVNMKSMYCQTGINKKTDINPNYGQKLTFKTTIRARDFLKSNALCSFTHRIKVIHPKYYKHLKKGAYKDHLGRQKMG